MSSLHKNITHSDFVTRNINNVKKIITFGTFDVFHHGHFQILKRASLLAEQLIIGVSSDAFTFSKKNRLPVYSEQQRMQTVGELDFVHHVFLEESFERKKQYIVDYQADILVMGDDWAGKFDDFNSICKVIYLERTPNISTTQLIGENKIELYKA